MFNLKPNTQKCLKDEVQAHQLIVIEFVVSDIPGQQVDYMVSVPGGWSHPIRISRLDCFHSQLILSAFGFANGSYFRLEILEALFCHKKRN